MKKHTLLDSRISAYKSFIREKRRKPSILELSEIFFCDLNTARCYKHRNNQLKAFNFETINRWDMRWDGLPMVCKAIHDKHGIYPTQVEISKLYGVTRQRVEQIIRRFEKRGVRVGLRKQVHISWDKRILLDIGDELDNPPKNH